MELLNWLKKLFTPKAAADGRSSDVMFSSSREHGDNVFDDTYFTNSSFQSCRANDSGGSDDSCSSDSGSSDGGGGGDGD